MLHFVLQGHHYPGSRLLLLARIEHPRASAQPTFKTMLVLEARGAESKGSINKLGQYQSMLMGLEVHVKDEARFPGKWAFFAFDEGKPASMIPQSADCYSCHTDHAAV